jgi:hypothetical protein
MLGLRLDEPLPLADGLAAALDGAALERLERLGLAVRYEGVGAATPAETLALTERGRFLGGAVTAELLS